MTIRDTIDNCCLCHISLLEFNKKDIDRGYGKLYGWSTGINKPSFFFVGLNPSYNRFKNLEHAFGGNALEEGTGREFVDMLKNAGILDHSYVTNAVKCSTSTNAVDKLHLSNCLEILKQEIKEVDPKVIIALGNDVHNFLKTIYIEKPVIKIWHPNYVMSYKRNKLETYKAMLSELKTLL